MLYVHVLKKWFVVSLIFFCVIFFIQQKSIAVSITVVSNLDLTKYQGKWYEIARLPLIYEKACKSNVIVRYTLTKDPKKMILTNHCLKKDKSLKKDKGYLFQKQSNGELRVSFMPFIKVFGWLTAPYDVMEINQDYTLAVIATPDKEHFWILSRTSSLPSNQLDALKKKYTTMGFDLTKLIVNHNVEESVQKSDKES